MSRTRSVGLMVVLLACAPAWAVNKCIGPDGKAVFQDRPCEGAGEKLTIRPGSGYGDAVAASNAQTSLLKMQRENAVAEAIRLGRPMVGMTIDQLQQAMGPASKVNADNYQGVQREQVIYERPSETWYVYTRNGIVDAIQNRPGGMPSRRPMQTASCPTAHEIRDAEVSASSNTLGDEERAERFRMIRDMRACGK